MIKQARLDILKHLRPLILRLRETSLTIRLRLLAFLLGLIMLLFLAVIVILLMTGTLTSGQRTLDEYFVTELDRLSADIEREYGQISVSAVTLAEHVASSSEQFLKQHGGDAASLQSSPELLQELLENNFDRLVLSLEKTRASGAFIIFDATVNQSLKNAAMSRAALYIKSLEPNIVSASRPEMTVLYGFADLGRKRGYALHSLWSMEFDLKHLPEYEAIKQQIQVSGPTDLSRQYIWGAARPIEGSSEQYMPCIVPLIDRQGNFFGVCGFEVSSLLFKLNYKPVSQFHQRINCFVAPMDDRGLILTDALAGGNFNSFSAYINKVPFRAASDDESTGKTTGSDGNLMAWLKPVQKRSQMLLYRFETADPTPEDSTAEGRAGPGSIFAGRHIRLRLMPTDSAYSDRVFASMLIIPEADYSNMLGRNNLKIAGLFLFFILTGVLAAVLISRKFISPIIRGLETAASSDLDSPIDSSIAEIDTLIAQLRDRYKSRTGQSLPDDLFEDFFNRLETLTPTEKTIAGYYMRGESTQDILEHLYISSSTLKTHSSHIYTKLNISSRDELQLYHRLIKKGGRLEEMEKRADIT